MNNPFQELNDNLLSIKESLSALQKDVQLLKDKRSIADEEVRYIDKKVAAKIASVSLSTIDSWRRSRRIMPYYFDTAVRFRYDEFMEFLAGHRIDRKGELTD